MASVLEPHVQSVEAIYDTGVYTTNSNTNTIYKLHVDYRIGVLHCIYIYTCLGNNVDLFPS